MDPTRFDRLTTQFVAARTRRGVLGTLAAVALGVAGVNRAAAVAGCRTLGELCREDANCCSGICARNAFGRHTCQCPAGTEVCDQLCVDPTTFQFDPNNCGGCGHRCPPAQCPIATCSGGVCTGIANAPCDTGADCCSGYCDRVLGCCPTCPGVCECSRTNDQGLLCTLSGGGAVCNVSTQCPTGEVCIGDHCYTTCTPVA